LTTHYKLALVAWLDYSIHGAWLADSTGPGSILGQGQILAWISCKYVLSLISTDASIIP